MATTFTIDPITRLEGHLKIEVTVDTVDSIQQVISAKSSGTMFRGFENILTGRSPWDAPLITQRICGVCPVSHGMAACKTLEDAFSVSATIPDNGRIMRNLVLGANFIQSHVLHFYHLAALDYINTSGILDMAPWSYRFVTPDMVTGATAEHFVNSYIAALAIRRKAHQMGAIFGGKLPMTPSLNPGGCTDFLDTGDPENKIGQFSTLLNEIRTFIDNVFIPDVELLASAFPAYMQLGQGYKKLLAYGVFEQDNTGTNKFFSPGAFDGTAIQSFDQSYITEDVGKSFYTSPSGLHPSVGQTVGVTSKTGAYSYVKAPRYKTDGINSDVYELGPLARMIVSGRYPYLDDDTRLPQEAISAMDRIAARVYETKLIADEMVTWLSQLTQGANSYEQPSILSSVSGMGLTEAPRGALGHWISVDADKKISNYQVITPTAWNASPQDDAGNPGSMEKALEGTPVADISQPVEILRIIHSFDPCLACSVHMIRPGKKNPVNSIEIPMLL